jgi:multiple sugar transport system substrate-binding protein
MQSRVRSIALAVAAGAVAAASVAGPASAQVDWQKYKGQEINVLLNNHPWTQALRDLSKEFTTKTGINVNMDVFGEEQFRARLTTVMQAKTGDLDGYMSLTIREGFVFDKAGWYQDLKPFIENKALTEANWNYEDFGAGLRSAHTINGKVVTIPINSEGPLFYWRKDIFEKCKVSEPKFLEDIPEAAKALKACDANQGVWAARGLRPQIPYGMAAFVHNMGGSFTTPEGKPGLCQEKTLAGLGMYASLLKDYGPVGAATHGFPQVIELLGQGRVAMVHESSNEFSNIMKFPGRDKDLGVKPLPPGKASGVSKPVTIGWGVAMSPYSTKKEATWLFWQWVTSAEIQGRLVNNGVAPPRSSVFNGEAFKKWSSELPIRQAWASALVEIGKTGTGMYQTNTPRIPESRELIGRAIQEALLGQKSIKDAACAADADLAKLE